MASRLYEDNILYTAYNDTSMLFALINKSKQINKNPKPSQVQGLFYLQTNENNQLSFLHSIAGSSTTQVLLPYNLVVSLILKFLAKQLFYFQS